MKVFIVGKGRIGGRWCEYFHTINEDGTVGGTYARKMAPKEKQQILKDIHRQRVKAMEELAELDTAQKILENTNQVTSCDW